jgi:predicted RNase H-like HicB family nuclease
MTVAAPHYAMIIDWSEADQAYLVTVPDLPGCRTHGDSYAEAARKGQDAIDGWVELQLADGRPLPAAAHTGIGEQFDPLARLLKESCTPDHPGEDTVPPSVPVSSTAR